MIDVDLVLAAGGLGLFSSLHCALMCGPLAGAGCSTRKDTVGYVAGRATTYVFAGALLGSLGLAHGPLLEMQTVASFAAAAFVVVYGLSYFFKRERLVKLPTRALPKRGVGLGLVTGILPCGLLFAAWALAASTGHPVRGALVMLVFSLVTLPALLAPAAVRPVFSRYARRLPPAVIGVAWCLLGAWLALRPFLVEGPHAGCH